MNFLHLAGHLGADPEVRYTSSGKKVTTLRLATKTRKGNTDETIWWRATVWGDQFDFMIPYLKKGSPLLVMGEMSKPEIYTDRNGQAQISMNMTAHHLSFSPFGKADKTSQSTSGQSEVSSDKSFDGGADQSFVAQDLANQGIDDDEVPF